MNTNPHQREILALCNVIRQTSFEIHQYLRAGHRELIYKNALAHRLRKKGIAVEQQQKVKVFDEDGTLLGFFKTDLMIEERLICEIKGVRELTDEHIAQILGYLRASRIEHGLLINFGAARLEVKKYILN
jgi:GxxExxY protein